MRYALVKDGEVLRTHDFGDDDAPELSPNKGAWLPVEVLPDPTYDADAEVLEDAAYAVFDSRVEHGRTKRARTLLEARALRRAALEAAYAQVMAAGFPWTFGAVDETLQVLTNENRTDWLILKDACRDAKAAGFGAAQVEPGIRTTSNQTYAVTVDQALTILAAMTAWGQAMRGNFWALGEAIAAAADAAAVLAIDVSQGW